MVIRKRFNNGQLTLDFKTPLIQLLSIREIFEKADERLLGQLAEDRRIERKPANTHPRVG